MASAHEKYMSFLETLTPESLQALDRYVTPDVHFRDPFNDVHGIDAMRRVFQDMFEQIGSVDFKIHSASFDGKVCMMSWQFSAKLRGAPWSFDGMSIAKFNSDGYVVEHIDHWDAARQFYERLPVIGWALMKIRAKVAA